MEQTRRTGQLHHRALCVSDIEGAVAFYTLVLGWMGCDGPRHTLRGIALYAGPAGTIGRWPQHENAPNVPHDRYSPGLDHPCFVAATPAEVDAMHERLQVLGARILNTPAGDEYALGH